MQVFQIRIAKWLRAIGTGAADAAPWFVSHQLRGSVLVVAILGLLTAPAISASAERHSLDIDVKNGNLNIRVTDIEVPGTGYNARITRAFNSKSLRVGLFGAGWCTDFESEVSLDIAGRIYYTECGAGADIPYASSDAEFTSVIDSLVARLSSAGILANFGSGQDLRSDWRARTRAAAALNLSPKVDRKASFLEHGRGPGVLTFQANEFVISDRQEQARFDKDGKFLTRKDSNGNMFSVDYLDGKPVKVNYADGRTLELTYTSGLVTAVRIGDQVVTYQYEDKYLVRVSGAKGTINYKYGRNGLIVSVVEEGGPVWSISLDPLSRSAMRLSNQEGCIRTLDYPKARTDTYQIRETRVKCGDPPTPALRRDRTQQVQVTQAVRTYGFEYDVNQDGERILRRSVVTSGGSATEVVYHSVFQRPISVKVGSHTVLSADYNPLGLVQVLAKSDTRSEFDYDRACRKVTRLKTGEIERQMRYDARCNLVDVSAEDGSHIALDYDQAGRIAMLTGSDMLMIEYDPVVGKPSLIEIPSVGNIVVTYKPNGEIDHVDSAQGPGVAVRVSGSFNKLLDFIAGTEEPSFDEFNQLDRNCRCSSNRDLFSH